MLNDRTRTFRFPAITLMALLSFLAATRSVQAFTASSTRIAASRTRTAPSPTRLPYSNTAENPLDGQQVQQLAEETAAKRPKLPNLFTAITVRDFNRLVTAEQQSENGAAAAAAVVVRYYAPWCRACKKAEPMFLRLAQERPDIKFVQVPILSSNSELIEQSGVTTIPWGQIYRPNLGLVQEAKLNTKHFSEFKSMVAELSI
jgi:thiol-disulfide isomerase/thioredoxin